MSTICVTRSVVQIGRGAILPAAADYSIDLNVRAVDVRVGAKGDIATELKSVRLDPRSGHKAKTRRVLKDFPDFESIFPVLPLQIPLFGLSWQSTEVPERRAHLYESDCRPGLQFRDSKSRLALAISFARCSQRGC